MVCIVLNLIVIVKILYNVSYIEFLPSSSFYNNFDAGSQKMKFYGETNYGKKY